MCGEGIEISENLTSVVYCINDGESRQEVVRWIGLAHGVIYSLNTSIWR